MWFKRRAREREGERADLAVTRAARAVDAERSYRSVWPGHVTGMPSRQIRFRSQAPTGRLLCSSAPFKQR